MDHPRTVGLLSFKEKIHYNWSHSLVDKALILANQKCLLYFMCAMAAKSMKTIQQTQASSVSGSSDSGDRHKVKSTWTANLVRSLRDIQWTDE